MAVSETGAPESLTLAAPAKINLFLRITGRRSDGYHTLVTLMQKLNLADQVQLTRISRPGIELSCPDNDLPENSENLAWRAARLFLDQAADRLTGENGGIRIRLHKRIPIAAGLGGGSSDAAAVLVGMNRVFATGFSPDSLARMAVQLGADVPFFVYDWPAAYATGIGDRLRSLPSLPDVRILLVTPDIEISTQWAYENFALTVGKKGYSLKSSKNFFIREPDQLEDWLADSSFGWLYNDLEQITAGKYPIIDTVKQEMMVAGALGAMMSGSGPTVFALFAADRQKEAKHAYHKFRSRSYRTFLVKPM